MAFFVLAEMTRRSVWVMRSCDALRGGWLEKLLVFLLQQWCDYFCWSLSYCRDRFDGGDLLFERLLFHQSS